MSPCDRIREPALAAASTVGGMSDQAAAAYDGLTTHLLADPDDDVDVTPDGLLVKGRLFAFLDGDDLVVELSAGRAADLVARGQALPFIGTSGGPSSHERRRQRVRPKEAR